ncbi:TetR/AcrR family transcriptional regulator [Actinophytocola sediminis]
MDGDTRETIREVALELFGTRGFDQTSLREIAERVGLTKASLYYHYPSKQALLIAIVSPLLDGWRSITHDAEDMAHTPDTVRHVLSTVLDVMLDNRSLTGIMLRDPAGVVAAAGSLWQDLIDLATRLTTWLAGPAPTMAERLRAIAALEVLGAALSSVTYLKEEVSDDELREVLLDSALGALRR